MSNKDYNFCPTLDGLNNITADSITTGNISSGTLTETTVTLSEIYFTNGTTTATLTYDGSNNLDLALPSTADYLNVNGQLSIYGYPNVKTTLDNFTASRITLGGINAWTVTNTYNTNLPSYTCYYNGFDH